MESPVPKTEPSGAPSGWPRISDYWPDAPHRLGPPADHYELPGVDATRTGPALHTGPPAGESETSDGTRWIGDPDGRTTKDLKPALLLAAVAVLVGGGVFAAVGYARNDLGKDTGLPAPPLPAPTAAVSPPATPPVSIGASPPAAASVAPTTAAAPPVAPATSPAIPNTATFELVNGVTQLRVKIGDVDDGFFKIGVADDSTITAKAAVVNGTVKVSVAPNGKKNGTARLDVLLSDKVRWSLRLRGGVSEAGLDLSGGRVGGIELNGGAATVDMSVPDQDAAIPIVERGGIGTWRIVTDGKEAVRAYFRHGAGSVTLYGDTDKGIDKGETVRFREDAFLKIDSEEGVGALTVQSR
ncbi:hypothetical protein [Actinoplanes sp. L3-i22]|uniref:hypothetical protein n=1 Tax=Actinoplanes sp. L3-i22 TaxID=2836373 RepID=UPI001C854E8E|nr:hypothetical protein [Actinoplanes sp. L3-i22]